MSGFVQEMFRRFGDFIGPQGEDEDAEQACGGALPQAVDHVVDVVDSRLKLVSDYSRRLQQPVAETLHYIDALVEGERARAMRCSRASFSEDPTINACFVSPTHIHEV